MRHRFCLLTFFAGAAMGATTSGAQSISGASGPLSFSFEGAVAVQTETDIDGGSTEFSVDRTFVRGGLAYRLDGGATLGLAVNYGRFDYDFDGTGAALWGDIEDYGISGFVRFETGGPTILVAPSLQYAYEDGADESDGETYGVILGATWDVSDRLTIGPGLGVFSEIGEDEDTNIFPFLIVDWAITDRWALSTGPTLGASQGPGLTLSYAWNDAVSLAVSGRYEEVRFALDDDGPAPGGIGEDSSIPVFASLTYSPNPAATLSAFAGVELGGTLKLEDAGGSTIFEEDYDPAPFFGVAARLRF
ncbi:MAG: hypothetical protein AAGK37_02025 [Pseudomonadota bacterium]